MFAIAAAILFLVGAVKVGGDSWVFWLLLGLMALSIHFAYDTGLPAVRRVVK